MGPNSIFDAAKAVAYAFKQVGKAYVFGAVGPDAFDCSGLVMMAWRKGGVDMPHNSTEQANGLLNPMVKTVTATRLNKRKLQPGDLVFYYPGISHVAMFTDRVGKRRLRYVVQATDPQRGIEHIWMFAYAKPVAYGYVNHS